MALKSRYFQIIAGFTLIGLGILNCSNSEENTNLPVKETKNVFSSSNGKIYSGLNSESSIDKPDKCVGGKDQLKKIKETDLMRCIRYGFTSEALGLIEVGVNLEAKSPIGDTALSYSVLTNNLEVFKVLLQEGANININVYGGPLIVRAIDIGNLEIVRLLLSNGADPNSTDLEGTPILSKAASNGNLEIVILLLESGVDIHIDPHEEFSGGPPLFFAISSENLEMIRFLLDRGADINQPEWYHNRTGLWITVCRNKNIEISQFLLKNGANPNIRDAGGFSGNPNDGRTPLMCAVNNGNVEMVKLLVSKGADVHEMNLVNKTVLDIAEERGNPEILDELIPYKLSPRKNK